MGRPLSNRSSDRILRGQVVHDFGRSHLRQLQNNKPRKVTGDVARLGDDLGVPPKVGTTSGAALIRLMSGGRRESDGAEPFLHSLRTRR